MLEIMKHRRLNTIFMRYDKPCGFVSRLLKYLAEEAIVFFPNSDQSLTVVLKWGSDNKRVTDYLIHNFNGKIVEEFTCLTNG